MSMYLKRPRAGQFSRDELKAAKMRPNLSGMPCESHYYCEERTRLCSVQLRYGTHINKVFYVRSMCWLYGMVSYLFDHTTSLGFSGDELQVWGLVKLTEG
jgi:hypothetical protein